MKIVKTVILINDVRDQDYNLVTNSDYGISNGVMTIHQEDAVNIGNISIKADFGDGGIFASNFSFSFAIQNHYEGVSVSFKEYIEKNGISFKNLPIEVTISVTDSVTESKTHYFIIGSEPIATTTDVSYSCVADIRSIDNVIGGESTPICIGENRNCSLYIDQNRRDIRYLNFYDNYNRESLNTRKSIVWISTFGAEVDEYSGLFSSDCYKFGTLYRNETANSDPSINTLAYDTMEIVAYYNNTIKYGYVIELDDGSIINIRMAETVNLQDFGTGILPYNDYLRIYTDMPVSSFQGRIYKIDTPAIASIEEVESLNNSIRNSEGVEVTNAFIENDDITGYNTYVRDDVPVFASTTVGKTVNNETGSIYNVDVATRTYGVNVLVANQIQFQKSIDPYINDYDYVRAIPKIILDLPENTVPLGGLHYKIFFDCGSFPSDAFELKNEDVINPVEVYNNVPGEDRAFSFFDLNLVLATSIPDFITINGTTQIIFDFTKASEYIKERFSVNIDKDSAKFCTEFNTNYYISVFGGTSFGVTYDVEVPLVNFEWMKEVSNDRFAADVTGPTSKTYPALAASYLIENYTDKTVDADVTFAHIESTSVAKYSVPSCGRQLNETTTVMDELKQIAKEFSFVFYVSDNFHAKFWLDNYVPSYNFNAGNCINISDLKRSRNGKLITELDYRTYYNEAFGRFDRRIRIFNTHLPTFDFATCTEGIDDSNEGIAEKIWTFLRNAYLRNGRRVVKNSSDFNQYYIKAKNKYSGVVEENVANSLYAIANRVYFSSFEKDYITCSISITEYIYGGFKDISIADKVTVNHIAHTFDRERIGWVYNVELNPVSGNVDIGVLFDKSEFDTLDVEQDRIIESLTSGDMWQEALTGTDTIEEEI